MEQLSASDFENLNNLLALLNVYHEGRYHIGICKFHRKPYIDIYDGFDGDMIAEQLSFIDAVEFMNNRLPNDVD
jgi:hypothetical protein